MYLTTYDAQRLRIANNGTGDIEANDFSKTVIMSCAKIYFQNVHKQYIRRFNTPDKYEEALIAGRHRARRQGVSNSYESVSVETDTNIFSVPKYADRQLKIIVPRRIFQ